MSGDEPAPKQNADRSAERSPEPSGVDLARVALRADMSGDEPAPKQNADRSAERSPEPSGVDLARV
ncbi:hypothetical protein ABT335_10520, partial [Streptomyces sp. NPDC000618]